MQESLLNDEHDEMDDIPSNMDFDLEEVFLQQMYRTINITLGAIISYIGSSTFDDLSEDQKDYVFEYVIDTWAMMLPPPVDDMWSKQVSLLALTQQIRNLAEQKREKQKKSAERDGPLKKIYEQLGWDFNEGEING